MYHVDQTRTLPNGIVAVDLRQARHNDYFRQARFYRRQDHRWEWTTPDRTFWSGAFALASTGNTQPLYPFTIVYPIEDEPVITAVFDRFTRAYLNLCVRLNCSHPNAPNRAWSRGLTLTVVIQTDAWQIHDVSERDGIITITMPSPRVLGYYENPNGPGDPIAAIAYDTLLDPVARAASGDYARWSNDRGGELFLRVIIDGQRRPIQEDYQLSEIFFHVSQSAVTRPDRSAQQTFARLFANQELLPLISVWDWHNFGSMDYIAQDEAEAVMAFIDERFGPEGVIKFLNAMGAAHALDEAIETSLDMKFGEFLPRWRQWIGR